METVEFESVLIRYDGKDAESHQIDLYQFGKSAQGIAKIIAAIGAFTLTGNYKKSRRNLECKVVIGVPKENCFSVEAFIKCIEQSPIDNETLLFFVSKVDALSVLRHCKVLKGGLGKIDRI